MPTPNIGSLGATDGGLAQEPEALRRTATVRVPQSAEREIPHSIEAVVDLSAREQHFHLTSFRPSSGEATELSPVLVPQRDEWQRLRVSRLTLPIIIAASAAVAGYLVYGFSTGENNRASSVAKSEGGTTSTGSSNSVPSPAIALPIEVPGDGTTSGGDRKGEGSRVTAGRIGATAISESAHEGPSTATSNTLPTGSAAPGDAASSVETPTPAVDSDAKHATAGDAISGGHATPSAARRPAALRTTPRAPGAFPGAVAPGNRTPVRSAERDIADRRQQRVCTEAVAVLGLCENPSEAKAR